MNTYSKFKPNVFLAKCTEKHEKGEVINVTNKYGKEYESVVFNLIFEKDNFYYYSIVRADGYNLQERAKAKAERYENWSNSAQKKSTAYYEASNQGKDFLVLGEPIKIGHHSENRHRNLIKKNLDRMGKSVEFSKKAEEHERKAEYWKKMKDKINLSMPGSIEYYRELLEVKKNIHEDLKNNKEKRSHSYSLIYAKKELNETQKKYDLAVRLWG